MTSVGWPTMYHKPLMMHQFSPCVCAVLADCRGARVNGADGISEMAGKAATDSRAQREGANTMELMGSAT
jgi:hypothetical protein